MKAIFQIIFLILLVSIPIFGQDKTPSSLQGAKEKPKIIRVTPAAGTIDDVLILQGKNLGENIDAIEVRFYSTSASGEKKNKLLATGRSIYLSHPHPITGQQVLKFYLPDTLTAKLAATQQKKLSLVQKLQNKLMGEPVKIRLAIQGEESKGKKYSVLQILWKLPIVLLSVCCILLVCLPLFLLSKKVNFLRDLLLDPKSNTYSLSRLQAFLWTIILLGSYIYVAVSWLLVLRGRQFPEFHQSLLGLLGISYSSLVSTGVLGENKVTKKSTKAKPSIRDFVASDRRSVDLGKLQLLCFTIIAIIIYLINLSLADILQGLPLVPKTLYGLLGASQVAYIGPKLITYNMPVIDSLFPTKWDSGEQEVLLQIDGKSFQSGTSVFFANLGTPTPARVIDGTTLKCQLKVPKKLGKHNLIVLPPQGTHIVLKNAIEIVDKTKETSKQNTEKENSPTSIVQPKTKFSLQQLKEMTGWGGELNQAITYKKTSDAKGLAKMLNDTIPFIKDTKANHMEGESYLKRKPKHMYTVNDYWCATIAQFLAIGGTAEKEQLGIHLNKEHTDPQEYAIWRFNHYANWQDSPWNNGKVDYYPKIAGCLVSETFTTDDHRMRELLTDESFSCKVFNVRREDNQHSFVIVFADGHWHRADSMDGLSDGGGKERNKQILNIDSLKFQNLQNDGTYKDNTIGIKCLTYYSFHLEA
ncbi:MAG: hypothetical protein AAF518_02120 [Spirochaetota bacterium]